MPDLGGDLSGQQATMEDPSTQQTWPAPDELDRRLRRSFLTLLSEMDGTALNQYFTTPEGQRAQALLQEFATNHPPGKSSDKANDILNRVLAPDRQVPQTEP